MAPRRWAIIMIALFFLVAPVIAQGSGEYMFAYTWGSRGQNEGEFFFPEDVAIGPNGDVYIADTGNHRIQVFNRRGDFLRGWGRLGTSPGRFERPISRSAISRSIQLNYGGKNISNLKCQISKPYLKS